MKSLSSPLASNGGTEAALEAVDDSLDYLGESAKQTCEKKELWEYLSCDSSGGRRLFRSIASKEHSTVERLLTGGREDRDEQFVLDKSCEELIARFCRGAREDASFDPVRRVLETYPTDEEDWYEKNLSVSDVAVDVIQARLTEALAANECHVARGLDFVRQVEESLEGAAIQTTNARRKLGLARQDTVVDVLALLQLRRRRLRAQEVREIAAAAKGALDLAAQATQKAVVDCDYESAVRLALSARDALETEPVRHLDALGEARRDLADNGLPGLCVAIDEQIWRATTTGSSSPPPQDILRISALGRAFAMLEEGAVLPSDDRLRDDAGAQKASENWFAGDRLKPKLVGAASSLVARPSIGDRVCAYSAARLAALAVDALASPDAPTDLRLSVVDSLVQSRDDPSSSSPDASFVDLDASSFAPAIVKICSDAVATLDLVRRLADFYGTTTDDDREGSGRRRASRAALVAGLNSVRRVAWRCLSAGLGRCAAPRGASSSRPPRIEDVVASFCAVALLGAFCRGGEFDSERAALAEVGKAYMRAVRSACVSTLSSMLECEPWCSVRVDDTSMAFVPPVFSGGQQADSFDLDQSRLLAAELEKTALFNDRAEDHLSGLCTSIRSRVGEHSQLAAILDQVLGLSRSNGNKNRRPDDEADDALLDARFLAALDAVFRHGRESEGAETATTTTTEAAAPAAKGEDATVATQAACSGLGRALTRFAQTSLLVEGAEDEVVDASFELFDTYAREVALTFVPKPALRAYAAGKASDEDDVFASDVTSAEELSRLVARIFFSDEDSLRNAPPPTTVDIETEATPPPAPSPEAEEEEWLELASRHIVAAESLRFAVGALRTSVSAALARASPGRRSVARRRCGELATAVDQLVSLVYRSLGQTLAGASKIIFEAIVSIPEAWAAEMIQEDNNGYVDDCAKRLDRLWTVLNSSSTTTTKSVGVDAKLLQHAPIDGRVLRETLWNEAVQACFEAVVDGFAAVSHDCSTEGRALMSMDLQVLQFSLDKIHRARPARGAVYADSYIKAFYLADEDLDAWMNQNQDNYKQKHVRSLAQVKSRAATTNGIVGSLLLGGGGGGGSHQHAGVGGGSAKSNGTPSSLNSYNLNASASSSSSTKKNPAPFRGIFQRALQ